MARIISVTIALLLIILIGSMVTQQDLQQATNTSTASDSAESSEAATTEGGGETATTTASSAEVTTLTLTTSRQATSTETSTSENTISAATVTETVTVTAATETEATSEPSTGQGSQDTSTSTETVTTTGTVESEQSLMLGKLLKIRVDKTIKAKEGWVAIKAITLSLDDRAGTLRATVNMSLPNPCWKAKASMSIEDNTAVLTIQVGRGPDTMCIQAINDITLTAETRADNMPGKLTIIVLINGERHVINIDAGESFQPMEEP